MLRVERAWLNSTTWGIVEENKQCHVTRPLRRSQAYGYSQLQMRRLITEFAISTWKQLAGVNYISRPTQEFYKSGKRKQTADCSVWSTRPSSTNRDSETVPVGMDLLPTQTQTSPNVETGGWVLTDWCPGGTAKKVTVPWEVAGEDEFPARCASGPVSAVREKARIFRSHRGARQAEAACSKRSLAEELCNLNRRTRTSHAGSASWQPAS